MTHILVTKSKHTQLSHPSYNNRLDRNISNIFLQQLFFQSFKRFCTLSVFGHTIQYILFILSFLNHLHFQIHAIGVLNKSKRLSKLIFNDLTKTSLKSFMFLYLCIQFIIFTTNISVINRYMRKIHYELTNDTTPNQHRYIQVLDR